jgi:plastocyanin
VTKFIKKLENNLILKSSKRYMRLILICVITLIFFFGCAKEEKSEPDSASETPAQALGNTGTIVGKITYSGTIPARKAYKIDKDIETCGKEKLHSEDIIISETDNGIKNTVITTVTAGLRSTPGKSESTPQLDQMGCRFIPHVQVIQTGEILEILNSDGILHNIHTFSYQNPHINKAQPGSERKMEVQFEFPEVIRVKCDAHSWMDAWIVVTDNPYHAVTDSLGFFRIENVPEGSHTLQFWHETLGKRLRDVSVKSGVESNVRIQYSEIL